MAACLYSAMELISVPSFLLMSMVTAHLPAQQRGVFAVVGFAIVAPFLCAAIGRNVAACNVYAVVGLIGAALYNLLTKWIGGIEVEVE